MARMGASGAGKSTLLDALSMRSIGASTMDGSSVEWKADGRGFSKTTAYCEQMDTHEANQTVREALRLSAYLRQPPQVSREGKDNSVEELIQLLEMEDFADASIGDQESGLFVEEHKKVIIGVELAAKPDLICQAITPQGSQKFILKGGLLLEFTFTVCRIIRLIKAVICSQNF